MTHFSSLSFYYVYGTFMGASLGVLPFLNSKKNYVYGTILSLQATNLTSWGIFRK